MSVKISELTASTGLSSADFIPVVDNSDAQTQKATLQQVLNYVTVSTFNSLTVTSLTASNVVASGSFSGSFVGNGSGLTNLTIPSGSFTLGSTSITLGTTITTVQGLSVITGSIVTGSTALFTTVSASQAEISGNLVIYGSASLAQYPDYAYVLYTASYDKIVVYPGLYVSGNLTGSGLGAFQTVSASTYLGLPTSSFELTKLIVSSSVSLTSTQRAVFAKNNISSSFSITLPTVSSADSKEYHIIKADSISGSVIISGSSPNLINGQATYELNGPHQAVTLIHDGSDWYIF
jgi:hypothetical protein